MSSVSSSMYTVRRHPLAGSPLSPSWFLSGVPIMQFLLLTAVPLVRSGDAHKITLESIDPSPVQCLPSTFRWSGGTPPFFVNLFEQGGANQRHLGPTNDTSYMWFADLPGGTVLKAMISGSSSQSNGTRQFTVQFGIDDTCLGVPASSSSAPSFPIPIITTSSTNPGTGNTTGTRILPSSSSPLLSLPSRSSELTRSSALSTILSRTPPSPTAHVSRQEMASSLGLGGGVSSPVQSSLSSSSTMSSGGDASFLPPPYTTLSTLNPIASTSAFQSASSHTSPRGRVAGIVIGCFGAICLAVLSLCLLRRGRRARVRSRITSMTTVDTLAFTATTWSDLSPSEPGKPRGANKKVTEWRADLFARTRDTPRNRQNGPSSPSVPFHNLRAPLRMGGAQVTSLSTIPEASADSSVPSPVESDHSASTAPSLLSYRPLMPQTVTTSDPLSQHLYPPAAPPAVQVPVNPFRARLLAAAGREVPTAWNGHSGDPFL